MPIISALCKWNLEDCFGFILSYMRPSAKNEKIKKITQFINNNNSKPLYVDTFHFERFVIFSVHHVYIRVWVCVWMCACECWCWGGQKLRVSLELEPAEVDAETQTQVLCKSSSSCCWLLELFTKMPYLLRPTWERFKWKGTPQLLYAPRCCFNRVPGLSWRLRHEP